MPALRELFRSIPDRELPHLGAQMANAARALGAVSAAVTPIITVSDIARGVAVPERAVLAGVLAVAGFLAVWLLASTRWGKRRGDLLLLGYAVHMVVLFSSMSWTTRATNHFVALSPMLPVLLAAFVPWRPLFSMLIAGPSALIPLAVEAHVRGKGTGEVSFHALQAVCFGAFAATANQLHRLLWQKLERARAQLTAAARTSALGQMTAGIAHELKTPVAAALNDLAGAKALVAELGESIGHPDVGEDDLRAIGVDLDGALVRIERAVARAARFVQAIRTQTVCAGDSGQISFSVGARANAIVPLFAHRLRHGAVRLDVDAAMDRILVTGDPGKLEQILVNLIGNAVDACTESGKGSRVAVSAKRDAYGVTVVVEDDGPGVPKHVRARIFEPLFTTRASGEGTGLGLSIARDLAEAAFGGSLALVPSRGGARFELRCPDAGAASMRRLPWTPSLGGETVRTPSPR